jgi:hypothetical protein
MEHGPDAHAPDEYYLIESTNPQVQGLDGAVAWFVECIAVRSLGAIEGVRRDVFPDVPPPRETFAAQGSDGGDARCARADRADRGRRLHWAPFLKSDRLPWCYFCPATADVKLFCAPK